MRSRTSTTTASGRSRLLSHKLVPRADDPLPWDELGDYDAVYFTGGDAGGCSARARAARVVVATARELPTLKEAGVELDVLVRSADDESERYTPGDLDSGPEGRRRDRGQGGRHVRRRRRLGPVRCPVAPRGAGGHLRRRRLVRGRAHLRARARRPATRRPRARIRPGRRSDDPARRTRDYGAVMTVTSTALASGIAKRK